MKFWDMPRDILKPYLGRVASLVNEIDAQIPSTLRGVEDLRADLAGMLVVTTAAMYESCVKEVMIQHAAQKHIAFEGFVERNFEKLSSRIQIKDLHRYAKVFDADINLRFKSELNRRKKLVTALSGKDLTAQYEQLLSWRHDFAHAGKRNTTIEEAVRTHRLAKLVIIAFCDAFEVT